MAAYKEMGWVKLYRTLINNDLWLMEPFTKGQAWVDLIMLAAHTDTHTKGLRVERGSFAASVSALSARWKWDRKKVRSFLCYLERREMITQERLSTRRLLIKIVKYSKYQSTKKADGDMGDWKDA